MNKIDKIEAAKRTILMMAHFLHRHPREIQLKQHLRTYWHLNNRDFEVLELWIEGPISPSMKGFFQDVKTDVRVADLQNPKIIGTVESLVRLIWKCTPPEHKKP